MLVVMHSHATPAQVEDVIHAIRAMNLTAHPLPGATRTAIGITGNISAVDPRTLEVLPGVMELIRVTKPYKLASREMHEADTFIHVPASVAGTQESVPAAVESVAGAEVLRSPGHEARAPAKTVIGPGTFTLIAGPCSVENEAMI